MPEGIIFAQTSFALRGRRKKLPSVVRTLFCYYRENKPFTFSGITSFSSEELAFHSDGSQQGSRAALQFAAVNKNRGRDGSEPLDRQLVTLGGQTNYESEVWLGLHRERWQIAFFLHSVCLGIFFLLFPSICDLKPAAPLP